MTPTDIRKTPAPAVLDALLRFPGWGERPTGAVTFNGGGLSVQISPVREAEGEIPTIYCVRLDHEGVADFRFADVVTAIELAWASAREATAKLASPTTLAELQRAAGWIKAGPSSARHPGSGVDVSFVPMGGDYTVTTGAGLMRYTLDEREAVDWALAAL